MRKGDLLNGSDTTVASLLSLTESRAIVVALEKTWRALQIFKKFLASYAFTGIARPTPSGDWVIPGHEHKKLRWPEHELQHFWQAPRDEPIGIPQVKKIQIMEKPLTAYKTALFY